MKEFFSYFFGKGDVAEFKHFSLAHFLPIILMIVIILLIYRYRDKIREFKYLQQVRITLSFMLMITEMAYFWRLVGVESLNANAIEHLPITVCGWCVIFCSVLVLTKNQTLFDISYFWLFSGTIFALITPTVITYTGPSRFRYYQFWLEHTLGYITIFFMIFIDKMRPTIKSMIKSAVTMAVLMVVAIFANTILDGVSPNGERANYLFMATVEETSSILNLLPSNMILRIIVMASIVMVFFVLSYIPWIIIDKKKKKGQIK